MGAPAKDLTGMLFGDLIVLIRDGSRGKSVLWRCACSCGGEKVVLGQNLKNGSVRSCGCKSHPKTHGMTDTRLYQTWASMHARCRSKSYHARQHYTDRGIAVCDEWKAFEPFRDWALAKGYSDDLTLDRLDNDRGYAPDNCRFITLAEQQRNKRNHRMLTAHGNTRMLVDWAALLGVKPSTILGRLKNGWSVEDAVTKPSQGRVSA